VLSIALPTSNERGGRSCRSLCARDGIETIDKAAAARRRKENFLQARPEPAKSPKFADQLKTMAAIKAKIWSGSL
jgi:hypothetical protein